MEITSVQADYTPSSATKIYLRHNIVFATVLSNPFNSTAMAVELPLWWYISNDIIMRPSGDFSDANTRQNHQRNDNLPVLPKVKS